MEKVVNAGLPVSRHDLLQSQRALANLGNVQLPVEKERYWLAKTLGKLNRALAKELNASQEESNRLITLHGTDTLDEKGEKTGQKGIQKTDIATMKLYTDAMEKFNSETVTVFGARRVPLAALQNAGVVLPLADQAALEWLLEE